MSPTILSVTACTPDGGGQRATTNSTASSPKTSSRALPSAGRPLLPPGAVLVGLHDGDARAAVHAVADRLDLSWLHPGDSVLVKVASNSGNVHPAVTSPRAVLGMIDVLKARGAGRIVVADQAGVGWVRHSATGRYSSTRERFETNGLIATEADAEVHFFDDGAFDTDWVPATMPDGNHWPRGLWLPKIVGQVDHIVYMPRLAQHLLTGLTLGHKLAVGFLRDDSRHDLHNDADHIYEKYAEISYADEIRKRLRLTLTAGEQVLLHSGPDEGTAHITDVPLVVASTRLANHDAVASSFLLHLAAVTEPTSAARYSAATAPTANAALASGILFDRGTAGPWISDSSSTRLVPHAFTEGVTHDAATTRGWELSGGRPSEIPIVVDGRALDDSTRAAVAAHGEGLYDFS